MALLEQQIASALAAASAAGQSNPLLIGAFAFDRQASCLYVPGSYKRGELAPTEPSSVTAADRPQE